jgi:hypothetical protein
MASRLLVAAVCMLAGHVASPCNTKHLSSGLLASPFQPSSLQDLESATPAQAAVYTLLTLSNVTMTQDSLSQ